MKAMAKDKKSISQLPNPNNDVKSTDRKVLIYGKIL